MNAFSSLASVMSCNADSRGLSFSGTDVLNLQRNRAVTAVWEAQRAGREATPEFAQALGALRRYRWEDAWRALTPAP